MGKGAGVLSGNFEGAYPPKGFDCNPGRDVKGDGSWRSACNPTLMRWDAATIAAKVLWFPGLYTKPYRIL